MDIGKTVTNLMGAAAMGIALASSPAKAQEINLAGWDTPSISTSKYGGEVRRDIIDEVPGAETIVRAYKLPNGKVFNTLTYKGNLFGYYIDVDTPNPFSLIDPNGRGKFTHKYGIHEKIPTPSYLLR